MAELWSWAEQNRWSETNKQGLDAFIRRFLGIPYDFDLGKTWALVLWRCTYGAAELDAGEAIIFANGAHVELDGQHGLTGGNDALVEKKKK